MVAIVVIFGTLGETQSVYHSNGEYLDAIRRAAEGVLVKKWSNYYQNNIPDYFLMNQNAYNKRALSPLLTTLLTKYLDDNPEYLKVADTLEKRNYGTRNYGKMENFTPSKKEDDDFNSNAYFMLRALRRDPLEQDRGLSKYLGKKCMQN